MTDPAPPRKRPLDDDSLMAAYQAAAHNARGHLTDREWEQLACGELDDAARERAMTHILSCADCSTIHRAIIGVSEGARAFDPRAASGAAAHRSSWRLWTLAGGLAAAAVIAIAVVVDSPVRPRPQPDATRNGSAGAIVTITTPLVLPDRHVAWSEVAKADTYEVRLNDSTGAPAWSTRVTAAETELPAGVTLARGTYYLQVSAIREGVIVGTSALVPVRVE